MSEKLSLEEATKTDFGLSFHFAQGKPFLQRYLMAGLHSPYSRLFDRNTLEAFADNATEFQPFIPRIAKGHAAYTPDGVRQEFQDRWEDFRATTFKGEGFSFSPRSIVNITLERDCKFVSEGRLALSEFQSDPHASFFRNYVLLDNPTGSERLDEVFDEVRERLPEMFGQEGNIALVTQLQDLWTAHHPGQSFTGGEGSLVDGLLNPGRLP